MDEKPWWQRSVIYQIYPRSFQDSDGDGIGDLRGIMNRADYLVWLGVGAVWFSPFYVSPMADFGYDIADYLNIDPSYGSLADFDDLVEALHGRNLRIILDFVPNHTSDEHPWFKQSRGSRDNPRRDWYIWRDPAPGGGPPNNWQSIAGGGAWQFEPATGQYYYHAFLAGQPDLNWRNPSVREAMYEVLRFWLKRGADGFRVDAVGCLAKDPQFRDDPPNPDYRDGDPPFARNKMEFSANRPEVHDIVAEMRRVVDAHPGEHVLIGEVYLRVEQLVPYYGARSDGLQLPANFNLLWTPWKPEALLELIEAYEAALPPGAWPDWVLGNHDQSRIATRLGPAQARIAMLLLLTLRGTPTVYYGDELGLENVAVPPDKARDPFGINMPGLGQGRDPERSPMPWDRSANAGFTTGEPWLPLAADRQDICVAAQRQDRRSMLTLTRELLALRRREPALSQGGWSPVAVEGDVLAYARSFRGRRFVVVLNLDAMPKSIRFTEPLSGRIELTTHARRHRRVTQRGLRLSGNEGVVIACAGGEPERAGRP
ncbi:MAG: alpha-amylase family glycosyl hydrolase [Hyphomicrobiales bacterium]